MKRFMLLAMLVAIVLVIASTPRPQFQDVVLGTTNTGGTLIFRSEADWVHAGNKGHSILVTQNGSETVLTYYAAVPAAAEQLDNGSFVVYVVCPYSKSLDRPECDGENAHAEVIVDPQGNYISHR